METKPSVGLCMGSSAFSVELLRRMLVNLIKEGSVIPHVIMPSQLMEFTNVIIPPMEDVAVQFPHVTTDGILNVFCEDITKNRVTITPSLPLRCAVLGNSAALFLKHLGVSFDYDTDDGIIAMQPLANPLLSISSTHLATVGLTMHRLKLPSAVVHLYPTNDNEVLVYNIESIVRALLRADLSGGVVQEVGR